MIKPAPPFFLGIEIGGTKLQLVTATPEGQLVDRRQIAVDHHAGGEGIRAQIAAAVTDLQPRFAWAAAGIGYGGPVNFRTGRICCSHHIEGWDNFPLGDWLRELIDVPVAVENDTNVAALAEATAGAGAGLDPVFYTNAGSGVGGGLVVGGEIYHGVCPGESELGHVRLDRNGTIVEDRCSGWSLDRIVVAATREEPEGVLARLVGDRTEGAARQLGPSIAAGSATAERIVEVAGTDLAFALSHVVHLFHPAVIVLGGGVAQLGEYWRGTVERALPRFVMRAFQPPPEVRLAALGELAVPKGALLLAARAYAAENRTGII